MNKCLLYISAISFLTAGCDKQEEPIAISVPDNFYEQSHSSYMGVKGRVREIKEYISEPGDESFAMLSAFYAFNNSGNLTAFDPTGMQDDLQTYWLPVNATSYSYEYDGNNRLSVVREISQNETIRTYRFVYGDHSCYLPLPFDLKPMGEWLVKGVSEIVCDEMPFTYRFDGAELIAETTSDGLTEHCKVSIKDGYPESRSASVYADEEIIRKSETWWDFDKVTGKPLQRKETITEDNRMYTIITNYDPQGMPAQKSVYDETLTRTEYTYNSAGWLWTQTVDTDEKETGSMRRMYDVDGMNNWIRCEQLVTGFIGWEYQSGTAILLRKILY